MKSRWNDDEAAALADDLDRLAYVSRLVGTDPALVLVGGGGSSVKTVEHDLYGDPVDVLHVKGLGRDMAAIGRDGFAPLRLDPVARLAGLAELPDARLARELAAASLDPAAPAPPVEAIVHAVLPSRFVLHTPADAVLALTNTPAGPALVEEVFGDEVVVVPYALPGLALGRACAERFHAGRHEGTLGMVVLHHGLYTFAADARTAYENQVDLVARALARAEAAGSTGGGAAPSTPPAGPDDGAAAGADPTDADLDSDAFGAGDATAFGAGAGVPGAPAGGGALAGPGARVVVEGDLGARAMLRRDISAAAGAPMILRSSSSDAARRFAARDDLAVVSQAGPATPDHVLRTKRVPLVGRDVEAYARAHRAYVERHRPRLGDRAPVPIDPAPRLVVDPELGVLAAGRRVREAVAAAEIYDHTIWVIERAAALGGYAPAPEADVFDVEYRHLGHAETDRGEAPAPLSGRIALVTGAASGIGRAATGALLAAGAAVVGLDVDAAVGEVADGPEYAGVRGDAGDPDAVGAAVDRAVRAFGGLDALVVDAGAPPAPEPVAELAAGEWTRSLAAGAAAAAVALRAAYPFLRASPGGGSVVMVTPAGAPAPGSGAAAHAASRATLTGVAREAALEWAADGVRVNVVHPGAEVPEHVAGAVVALCGPTFARTTGAEVPVGESGARLA